MLENETMYTKATPLKHLLSWGRMTCSTFRVMPLLTAIQLAIDKENDDFFDANEVLYDQTFSLLLPSLTMDLATPSGLHMDTALRGRSNKKNLAARMKCDGFSFSMEKTAEWVSRQKGTLRTIHLMTLSVSLDIMQPASIAGSCQKLRCRYLFFLLWTWL